MIPNDAMKPGRFARWARARALIRSVVECLNAGGSVVIGTYTKATQYDARHVEWFKATRTGAYVRHGKGWDCIDHSGIRYGRRVGVPS